MAHDKPGLGPSMDGPSGRQEMQLRLVMTPRIRQKADEDKVRAQTALPPRRKATKKQ